MWFLCPGACFDVAYSVKEIVYTLQGEGARAGRAVVLCRFTGCNLWSGREKDRRISGCWFCDTDFLEMDGESGGKYETAGALFSEIAGKWPKTACGEGKPYVVFTGGEPLLQLDVELIERCKTEGWETGVETNGTIEAPPGLDWICVSPKPRSELKQRSGNEIKIVFPMGVDPSDFENLDFEHFFLQPLYDPVKTENTRRAAHYCLENPRWKLSLQIHKVIGLP